MNLHSISIVSDPFQSLQSPIFSTIDITYSHALFSGYQSFLLYFVPHGFDSSKEIKERNHANKYGSDPIQLISCHASIKLQSIKKKLIFWFYSIDSVSYKYKGIKISKQIQLVKLKTFSSRKRKTDFKIKSVDRRQYLYSRCGGQAASVIYLSQANYNI